MPAHRSEPAPKRRRVAPFEVQRQTWRLLRGYLGRHTRRFPVLTVLSLGTAICQVTTLVMLASAAIGLASGKHRLRVAPGPFVFHLSLSTALIVAACSAACMIAFQVTNGRVSSGLAALAQSRCRSQLLDAYLGTSWELASQQRRGELQQLLTTHMERVAQTVSYLSVLLFALCNVTLLVGVAVLMSPVVAICLGVGVNILTLPLRTIKQRTRQLARRHGIAETGFAAYVARIVEQARETQLFDVADGVTEHGRPLEARAAQLQRKVTFLQWTAPATYAGLALLGFTGALAVLTALHIGNLASTGSLVLLLLRSLSYGQQAQVSLQGMAEAEPYLQEIANRRATYLQNARRSGQRPVSGIDSIELREVSYRYPGSSGRQALTDVTLTIERGSFVGIVGPTGSGKSTLAQVLLRLREPTSGSYLINGVDVASYDRTSWARAVAFVPQNPVIVDGTVTDNIRFYRPWLTDADVWRAAEDANLTADVGRMPQGFDTELAGLAIGLSGGQQQRLCIARALAGRPELLVLDEPTSALDVRSEQLFQQTIESLAGSTTVVVIAHRPTTIRSCDRIVVVEKGTIRDVDTPDRLLRHEGFYLQMRNQ